MLRLRLTWTTVLVVGLVLLGCVPVSAPTTVPAGEAELAEVVRVIDGDTIHVLIDGRRESVRYIGIDAPETLPGEPPEPFGLEAAEANRRLVGGRTVRLESDVSDRDRHGRLLRHVWLESRDGWLLVSRELVALGLAEARSYPPDTLYDGLLADAQTAARASGGGIWSD